MLDQVLLGSALVLLTVLIQAGGVIAALRVLRAIRLRHLCYSLQHSVAK